MTGKVSIKLGSDLARLLKLEKASNPGFKSMDDVLAANLPLEEFRRKYSKLLQP